MVNKVILIGNLGKDPEIRTLESGSKVASFTLATNESYKDKNNEWQTNTEWHNIVAWSYLADKAERELKKGSSVFVEGKLTYRKYNDKNGVEKYITEIVASSLNSLDKKERISINPSDQSVSAEAPVDNSDMPF
ncbi:MAG: single-stranded DNA-binding protein [Saprospiraceae bacterium]|nr:single-stranded DNA-binding protein [Saprospiraceae bacterium]